MSSFCKYFNQGICSSCTRIEEPYSQQLTSKSDHLEQLLGGLFDSSQLPEKLPPVSSSTLAFRNKAKFSVTGTLQDPNIGLTGIKDLDEGRDISECSLHRTEMIEFLPKIRTFIQESKLLPYQIKTRTGELKGIILYYSPESKQMYLRLVLRSKESIARIEKFKESLLSQCSALVCFSANIQPIPHAILEGEEEIFFTDQHFIDHQLSEIKMRLHPQGFVQTNQEVALKLYSTAAEWVRSIGAETFIEWFSGQGAFSFFIQKFVKKARGFEINPEAVERANQTAKENGWDHLSFITKDAGSVFEDADHLKPDVLLVNPPRRGLGASLTAIQKIKSPYFIYSSCNAETLSKDLAQLKDHYRVVKYQLFDMFPHTDHFETLVLLKRVD